MRTYDAGNNLTLDEKVLRHFGLPRMLRSCGVRSFAMAFGEFLTAPSPAAVGKDQRGDASVHIVLRNAQWRDRKAGKSGVGATSLVAHLLQVPRTEAADVIAHELHRSPGGGAIRPQRVGPEREDLITKVVGAAAFTPRQRAQNLLAYARQTAPAR